MTDYFDKPFEQRMTREALEREVRLNWDREQAFRDAISELPEVPSVAALWFLQNASSALRWPDAWSIGKELQLAQPYGAIPAKTELEIAAGLWAMIREGILARIPPLPSQQEE